MENVFLKLLNMSISAGWLVLAVLVLRPLMKRVPKALHCLLWGLVGLRLIWPFSIESILSLLPSAETVPPEIVYEQSPAIQSGVPAINGVVNPILSESFAANPVASANPIQIWLFLAAILWIGGMAVMTLYALISYGRIAWKVRVRMPLGGKLYLCDAIDTPFILGIFRPKIFLPSGLDGEDRAYVIAHEEAHLKRRDHWWKPMGFLLLTVYWFNPLMWVAYLLLCRDIEMACDEKVIRSMDVEDKKAYSQALLQCSAPRRMISACPLAFGEVGVARRVRSVLHYKKPAFWIILLALIASIVLALCFLTDPLQKEEASKGFIPAYTAGSDYPGVSIGIKELQLNGASPYLEIVWSNATDQTMEFGEPFTLHYQNEYGVWMDNLDLYGSFFELPAYPVNPHKTASHSYGLSNYNITQAGKYRFQTDFHIEGKEYAAWIEFDLELLNVCSISSVRYGSTYPGVSIQFVSVGLGDVPYLEIEWINETDQDVEFSGSYTINPVAEDGSWISYQTHNSIRPIFENSRILPANSKARYQYPIYGLESFGYYRFESKPVGESGVVRLVFKVDKKSAGQKARIYNPIALTYVGGSYSYVQTPGGAPCIQLVEHSEGIDLQIYQYNHWQPFGQLTEITLTESNFDSRFRDLSGWEEKTDAATLRRNNRQAYEVKQGGNLYLVLMQKDGTVYYANGEYDCEGLVNPNEDASHIRWLYRTEYTGTVPAAKQNVSTLYFTYPDSVEPEAPALNLFPVDQSFDFCYSVYSSYLAYGFYEREGDDLILSTKDGLNTYVFKIRGQTLIFDASRSSEIPNYKYSGDATESQCPVPDGAVFETGLEGETIDDYIPKT